MKLIDETKEKIHKILEEYFEKKKDSSRYRGDDELEQELESILEDVKSDINVSINHLEKELDDKLVDPADMLPSRYEMMCEYDAFRENELADAARRG